MNEDVLSSDLDREFVAPIERETPCLFRTGKAGSGKTYGIIQEVTADPKYGLLTSTTGISAVNLGNNAITLNSTLKFFDTLSFRDAYLTGFVTRILRNIAREYKWLVVEECSMLDGDQLDILYRAVTEANRYQDVTNPLGILLVGDMAQLPPVNAPWCFEASCWNKFAANIIRLDKVWRQQPGPFLDALNETRFGNGSAAVDLLNQGGISWNTQVHTEFEGTTILPRNQMVNRYNAMALDKVEGKEFTVRSRRWGQQRAEWGENKRTHEWGIPPATKFRIGAYVTIKANSPDFEVVNGDCGWITDEDEDTIRVRLVRTNKEVNVGVVVRHVDSSDRPDNWRGEHIPPSLDLGEYIPHLHYRAKARRYIFGQVEYFPIALAYASTVHRSQSLTLDRVQIDFRDHFCSAPAMLYVAMSRCRTLEGLRLVGTPERFVTQCNMERKVIRWL